MQKLILVFFSILAIGASVFGTVKGIQFWKNRQRIESKIFIKAIVQTGPQKEALKTSFLAELLHLSVDHPTLGYRFDIKQAQQRLLHSPVIKHAEVKMQEPGILHIDYTVRQPIAFLSDFQNVAIDQEGYPFPLAPFFTPKKIPEIFLGIEENIQWNKPLTGSRIELAFELLKVLQGPLISDLFNIKRIDVSNAFERSFGRREIVLCVLDELYLHHKDKEVCFHLPRILRLSPKKYLQELSNYLKLREQLLEKEKQKLKIPDDKRKVVLCPQKIIDFRVPQLAFIEEG